MAVILGGAAGCSSAAPPPEQATAASAPDLSEGATAAPQPFEGLLSTAQDNQKALHDAEEQAVAQCMKAQGFRYTPQEFEPSRQGDPGPRPGDVAGARTRGYGIAESKERGEKAVARNNPEANPDLAKLGPAERQAFTAALLGPPPSGPNDPSRATIAVPGGASISVNTNGCASKARTAVYGDDIRWQQLVGSVQQLQGEVYDQLVSDPSYVSAVAQWRSCMRGKGFNYERPTAAREVLTMQLNSGEIALSSLKSTEIQVATADAECFQAGGMANLTAPLVAKYEQKVADANQGVIVEFRELQEKSIARARSLLRTGSG
ncbi:MAG TPA: hypothetical protein VHF27_05370 [Acidimicrobiales bacterium]|nr:hypothetical protein [Acidimicrobiales bacterium]